MTLTLSILLGLAFGIALNRAGATNPDKIISMLNLSDLHLMKAIFFAIGIASLFLFTGMKLGIIDPSHISVKAAYTGVILGGMLLGVGFALAGYCPGTGLAAAATGRTDAFIFVLGGLAGAFAYTLSHASIKATGLLDNLFGGKVTLADTGNAKFNALIDIFPGSMVAGIFALILIVIAFLLPMAFRGSVTGEADSGQHGVQANNA